MTKDTKKPAISVVERRLKSGAIFRAASSSIPMREVGRWALYIGNADISPQRIHELLAQKGWAYVSREDLAIEPEAIGFREMDGRIVSGQHGHEILLKMERADYAKVQAEKDRLNREQTFSKKGITDTLVNQAAQDEDKGGLGRDGRAAEFLSRAPLGVVDSRERVSLDD